MNFTITVNLFWKNKLEPEFWIMAVVNCFTINVFIFFSYTKWEQDDMVLSEMLHLPVYRRNNTESHSVCDAAISCVLWLFDYHCPFQCNVCKFSCQIIFPVMDLWVDYCLTMAFLNSKFEMKGTEKGTSKKRHKLSLLIKVTE